MHCLSQSQPFFNFFSSEGNWQPLLLGSELCRFQRNVNTFVNVKLRTSFFGTHQVLKNYTIGSPMNIHFFTWDFLGFFSFDGRSSSLIFLFKICRRSSKGLPVYQHNSNDSFDIIHSDDFYTFFTKYNFTLNSEHKYLLLFRIVFVIFWKSICQ